MRAIGFLPSSGHVAKTSW